MKKEKEISSHYYNKYNHFKQIVDYFSLDQFIINITERENDYCFMTGKHKYRYDGHIQRIQLFVYLTRITHSVPLTAIEADIDIRYVVDDNNRIIYADYFILKDIKGKVVNQGFGTMLMDYILYLAKEIGVTRIIGTLSEVDERDKNNKKRRNHFYEKYGFIVDETKHTIEKNI